MADIAWDGVVEARYRIEQSLRYEYERPIHDLQHRLIIAPRARHHDQERYAHRLWATPAIPLVASRDAFGNDIASVSVDRVEREIAFGLETSLVRRARGERPTEAFDARWLDVGRLTALDPALADAAADLRRANADPFVRAHAIVRFVHAHMTYAKRVTDVGTTAAQAFAGARGVCQDFAHIAISLARASGIGARYASGHLLGEGATHAWVEFLVPRASGDVTVLSLDPTYCNETDFRYIVVAIGRDYDDVPPTSGVFRGTSAGTLTTSQHVRVTELVYAA